MTFESVAWNSLKSSWKFNKNLWQPQKSLKIHSIWYLLRFYSFWNCHFKVFHKSLNTNFNLEKKREKYSKLSTDKAPSKCDKVEHYINYILNCYQFHSHNHFMVIEFLLLSSFYMRIKVFLYIIKIYIYFQTI